MEAKFESSSLLVFKQKELLASSLDKTENNDVKASLLIFPAGKKGRQRFGRLEGGEYVVYTVEKKTGCTCVFRTKNAECEVENTYSEENTNISYNNNSNKNNISNDADSMDNKGKSRKHHLQRKKSSQSNTVSCATVYDDQLFIIRGELLEAYSRKGSCFFYVKTPITESVHTLVIDTPFIFIAGTFIVTAMQEAKQLGFYLCPDRILSFVAFIRNACYLDNKYTENTSVNQKILALEPESSSIPEEELFNLPLAKVNNSSTNDNNNHNNVADSNGSSATITTKNDDKTKKNKIVKGIGATVESWDKYLCCCGCVDRYIRVLRTNNIVFELCCEAAVTALHADLNQYRLYYGTQTGSVGVCEITTTDSLRKIAVMHSHSTLSSSSVPHLPSTTSSLNSPISSITSIYTFDFNNDGKEELVVGYEDGCVSVYAMLLQEQQHSQQQHQTPEQGQEVKVQLNRTLDNKEQHVSNRHANREFESRVESCDNSIVSGTPTILFILLWRVVLKEKVVRVTAGNVISSHKTQPDLLVQCGSNKIYAFTMQESSKSSDKKYALHEASMPVRALEGKVDKQHIESQQQEEEQQEEEQEEQWKELHKECEEQVNRHLLEREKSELEEPEKEIRKQEHEGYSATSEKEQPECEEESQESIEHQNMRPRLADAETNYTEELAMPIDAKVKLVRTVENNLQSDEIVIPMPEVTEMAVPVPMATFVGGNQRSDGQDNSQNNELEQIQEMEMFKLGETRLRTELQEKLRIARAWDATQAEIVNLRAAIEECQNELNMLKSIDNSNMMSSENHDLTENDQYINTTYEHNGNKVADLSYLKSENIECEGVHVGGSNEMEENSQEYEERQQEEESYELSEEHEEQVELRSEWLHEESCLRCTFHYISNNDDNNEYNNDYNDEDDGIAYILVSSALPINFVHLAATPQIHVIAEQGNVLNENENTNFDQHHELLSQLMPMIPVKRRAVEHNVVLVEVNKCFHQETNTDIELPRINSGNARMNDIILNLSVHQGFLPELAPHVSWHDAHTFQFMILRFKSLSVEVKSVHVPALATYISISNERLVSILTDSKTDVESSNREASNNSNATANDDNKDYGQIHRERTLSWLYYRGNFTLFDIENWTRELFYDWTCLTKEDEAMQSSTMINEFEIRETYQYYNEANGSICLIDLFTEDNMLSNGNDKSAIQNNNNTNNSNAYAENDFTNDDSDNEDHSVKPYQNRTIVNFVCKSDSVTSLFVIRQCLSSLISARLSQTSTMPQLVFGMSEQICYKTAYEELFYHIKPDLYNWLQEWYELNIIAGLHELFDINDTNACSEWNKQHNEYLLTNTTQSTILQESNATHEIKKYGRNEFINRVLTKENKDNINNNNDSANDRHEQKLEYEELKYRNAMMVHTNTKMNINMTLLPSVWEKIYSRFKHGQGEPLTSKEELEEIDLHWAKSTLSLDERRKNCAYNLYHYMMSIIYLYTHLRTFKHHIDAPIKQKIAELKEIVCYCASASEYTWNEKFIEISNMLFPHDEYANEKFSQEDELESVVMEKVDKT